jgi:hypothetical protein
MIHPLKKISAHDLRAKFILRARYWSKEYWRMRRKGEEARALMEFFQGRYAEAVYALEAFRKMAGGSL